jgi:glycosyltransferase involved in cell wall biosynthesis
MKYQGLRVVDRVSVIIPTYNAAEFIAEALDSVLAQTYDDLEVIVVDDGSQDSTADIVSEYAGVTLIRQSNSGAAAARNRALQEATGDYIAFLDADDLWLPDKTTTQVRFLSESGLKWCYCDSYFAWYGAREYVGSLSNVQGPRVGDVLVQYLSGNFSIPLPATMVKCEVFDHVGNFDETMRTVEHTDLWARIAVHYELGYVEQPLVVIRKRRDSLKETIDPTETGENARRMLQKVVALAPRRLEPVWNVLLANTFVREGKQLLRSGKIVQGRARFKLAIRQRPTSIQLYLYYLACFIEPLPKLFYILRWKLLHKRKPNLRPGWWVR